VSTLVILSMLAALPTAGCCLILLAGRRERLGRLDEARTLARSGGFVMLAGELILAAACAVVPSIRPAPLPVLAGTVLAFAVAGLVGLLAGLSGKPRPSGHVAATLHLAGLVVLVATT